MFPRMDIRTVKWIMLGVSVAGFFMGTAWGWIAWVFGMKAQILGTGGTDPASQVDPSSGFSLLGCEVLAGFCFLLGILGLLGWLFTRRREAAENV